MQKALQLSISLFLSVSIPLLIPSHSYSQTNEAQPNNNKRQEGKSLSERLKKDEKLQLDLEQVLNMVINNNLDVKKALLDYRASAIELKKYQSRFDYNLYFKPTYSMIENSPDNPSSVFQGTETKNLNVDAGLHRKFKTGTRIQLGFNGMYQNLTGAPTMGGIDFGGKGYQTGFVVSVSQEILKNMFGISDRLNEKILENASDMRRRGVKIYLANLLVEALIGYWSVIVAEDNLETVKISLDSTINIRNLVRKKQTLGLSEKEDLFDWNSKVLQSRNLFELAKKNLYDAEMAVVRTLNLEKGTDFDLVKSFKTTLPEVTLEQAFKDAFIKRGDLINQRTLLKNSEFERRIAAHNMEPSLKLNLSAGSIDYSKIKYPDTFNDVNKQWSVGFELTYPLGNNEAEAKMNQAMLNYKKNYVELNKLEKEIKDEIDSLVKQCDVMFSVFQENKKSKNLSKNYYNQVLKKFKRGRYDAVKLKLALDNYIQMRQHELKSLVDYNITLLRRDLARNVIFENYGINIDSILSKFE